jgi:hypothetical protein
VNETPAPLRTLDDFAASLRYVAALQGVQLAFLAEYTLPDENPLDPLGEYSSLEIAAVSRVTPRHTDNRIELAHALATRLPLTMAALREGSIDEYKARPAPRGAVLYSLLSGERLEVNLWA